MKAGIMTFPNSTSYGAVLQMFALYRTVKKLGYEAEIINYHNSYMKSGKHMLSPGRILRSKLTGLLHTRMHTSFQKFEKQMVKIPEKHFSDKKRLRKIAERYSAVICGSDQVWNPNITNGDLSFFLDFCGLNTSRIAYAPSFGVETLSEEFGKAVAQELKCFSSLSVREEGGNNIIQQLLGQPTQVVVDPTLLLDGCEWERYEVPCPEAQGDYILYYTIRSSDTLWEFCKFLAQKHNLKILRIGGNRISKKYRKNGNVQYVSDAGPGEWLYLLHHARYVVTNSFHGTAFSINYRKNFFVEFSSATNSRLEHITKVLGLEECVVRAGDNILTEKTDYSQTEQVLPAMIQSSRQYLKTALEDAYAKHEKK